MKGLQRKQTTQAQSDKQTKKLHKIQHDFYLKTITEKQAYEKLINIGYSDIGAKRALVFIKNYPAGTFLKMYYPIPEKTKEQKNGTT